MRRSAGCPADCAPTRYPCARRGRREQSGDVAEATHVRSLPSSAHGRGRRHGGVVDRGVGPVSAVTLRSATAADADRIAYVFTVSRRTAMPWLQQHHTAEEDRAWVEEVLLPTRAVTVAERRGYVVGYAATEDGWLTDLYVDPAAQGQGVGSALFAHAQSQQPRGFDIWVFQRNTPVLGVLRHVRTAWRWNAPTARRTWSGSPTSGCGGARRSSSRGHRRDRTTMGHLMPLRRR